MSFPSDSLCFGAFWLRLTKDESWLPINFSSHILFSCLLFPLCYSTFQHSIKVYWQLEPDKIRRRQKKRTSELLFGFLGHVMVEMCKLGCHIISEKQNVWTGGTNAAENICSTNIQSSGTGPNINSDKFPWKSPNFVLCILPASLTRFPVPADDKLARNNTLPPSHSTVGMVVETWRALSKTRLYPWL